LALIANKTKITRFNLLELEVAREVSTLEFLLEKTSMMKRRFTNKTIT
jgi:hypothetical protein